MQHIVIKPGLPVTAMTSVTARYTQEQLPKLQNIVSTFNLGCELDLRKIALNARNSEFNPKRFAACIMRIRDPKTTALIFKSGKVVCTGAKTEDISRVSAKMYAKMIRKIGYQIKVSDFKI